MSESNLEEVASVLLVMTPGFTSFGLPQTKISFSWLRRSSCTISLFDKYGKNH